MKQIFNIIRIETSKDMGNSDRGMDRQYINCEELLAGNVFQLYEKTLTVRSINADLMEFTYIGRTFRINRHWQVLGTPQFDITDEKSSTLCRYVFFFSKDEGEACLWSDEHAGELAEQMNKNDEHGDLWKNIPLVREFIHELKDIAPFRSVEIIPAYKAYYISCILRNEYIDKKETPRLFQSLCELYRVYIDRDNADDHDEFLEKNFDKSYIREVDKWIADFACIIDDPTSGQALECWQSLGTMLRTDPVQATQEWEDIIYDVESELEVTLKDEPRGMGFCFCYWSAKAAALLRRGIEWRSPAAMNPRVMFD